MLLQIKLESRNGSDESLEDLARSGVGSDAVFEQLVRRCLGRINRWALVATGDPDEADDVVQETLLRMHRHLGQFRGESLFLTWVYRITQSVVADLSRRRTSRLRTLLRLSEDSDPRRESPPAILERIERERQIDVIRTFWEELPPGQRKIFDLADLQGYTPTEIAEMEEMKPVTVRAQLFKARRTIRQRILDAAPANFEEKG